MDDELPGGVWRVDATTREGLRLDRIRQAMDQGAWEVAAVEAEELLEEAPEHGEALFLLGEALLELADYELARVCYEQRLALDDDDLAARLGLAIATFLGCDLDAAIPLLEEMVRREPQSAEAHHYLGLALERVPGRGTEALSALAAASQLDPARFPLPMQLDPSGWEQLVRDALESLHPALQLFWSGVEFLLQDLPPLDELRDHVPPLPPTVGAMYVGEPPEEPYEGDLSEAPRPDGMRLFMRNLGRAPSRARLVEQLGVALEEEALHWLGLPPDALEGLTDEGDAALEPPPYS